MGAVLADRMDSALHRDCQYWFAGTASMGAGEALGLAEREDIRNSEDRIQMLNAKPEPQEG